MSYRFADSLRAGSGRNPVPSWSCSQAVSKPVWHKPLLCVQWKTHDDGQRNCPKHVEYYSKNKYEKWLHLVGFSTRIYPDTWSPECQTNISVFKYFPPHSNRNFFLAFTKPLLFASRQCILLQHTTNLSPYFSLCNIEKLSLCVWPGIEDLKWCVVFK